MFPIRPTPALLLAASLVLIPGIAIADDAPPTAASSEAERGIFSFLPKDSTTEHVLETPAEELAYTATAGTFDLKAPSGETTAKIFYTAYKAKEADQARPLTFAFNGGPGAASAYLHLGLLGPKILDFGRKGADGTTPELSDNPESWLAFTDLVLIDPVGTGWSRASDEDTAKSFYGVNGDASSLAKAISLYVQNNDRLGAPIYLLGESYGGFRAAKVAASLKEDQGILASGLLMISPLLDAQFLPVGDPDPLTAALQLPSLAAARMERDENFTDQAIRDAEEFAMSDYLVAQAGPPPEGAEASDIYGRIADLTGIPQDQVAETRGFVGNIYTKQAAGSGQILSMYDANDPVADAYPELGADHNDDPVLDGFTRAYGPTFVSYARQDLGYSSEMTYKLLNPQVNRNWDWDGSRSQADASGDLRDLLSTIPSLRIAIFHGYSDILTPYEASRYVLNHLPAKLSKDRTFLHLYRGGHMFYTEAASRHQATKDARQFYSRESVN